MVYLGLSPSSELQNYHTLLQNEKGFSSLSISPRLPSKPDPRAQVSSSDHQTKPPPTLGNALRAGMQGRQGHCVPFAVFVSVEAVVVALWFPLAVQTGGWFRFKQGN